MPNVINEEVYSIPKESAFARAKRVIRVESIARIETEVIPAFDQVRNYFANDSEAERSLIEGMLGFENDRFPTRGNNGFMIHDFIDGVVHGLQALHKDVRKEPVYQNGARLCPQHLNPYLERAKR
jgi:hypothetical protein